VAIALAGFLVALNAYGAAEASGRRTSSSSAPSSASWRSSGPASPKSRGETFRPFNTNGWEAVLATVSRANALTLAANRGCFAMGGHSLLPDWFHTVSSRFETPLHAIVVTVVPGGPTVPALVWYPVFGRYR